MTSPIRPLTLAATLLTGVSLGHVSAGDWNQWRGPDRSARVTGFEAPSTWPDEARQVWKREIGDGVASPALVGDRLYTYSREDPDEVVRCLNAATGEVIWEDRHAAAAPTGGAGRYPGPRSSPTVAGDKVITYGVRGTLSCFEAGSGKLLWRKEGTTGGWPMFFTSSSPIVIDNLCIAQLGSDEEGSISAFDLTTGSEQWKWTGDGTAYASPVKMTVAGTTLVVAQSARKLVALEAGSGRLVWETPFSSGPRGNNTATPIVDGDRLIYAGSNRGVTAVRLKKEGNGFVSSEVWSNSDHSVQFSSPALIQGLVIGLSSDNALFCINSDTGRTLWTAPTAAESAANPGERRRGPSGFGSVVGAGSVALALTPTAGLIVFEPAPDRFKEIARVKVSDTPSHSYPVLDGNRIFIKDQDSIALLRLD